MSLSELCRVDGAEGSFRMCADQNVEIVYYRRVLQNLASERAIYSFGVFCCEYIRNKSSFLSWWSGGSLANEEFGVPVPLIVSQNWLGLNLLSFCSYFLFGLAIEVVLALDLICNSGNYKYM